MITRRTARLKAPRLGAELTLTFTPAPPRILGRLAAGWPDVDLLDVGPARPLAEALGCLRLAAKVVETFDAATPAPEVEGMWGSPEDGYRQVVDVFGLWPALLTEQALGDAQRLAYGAMPFEVFALVERSRRALTALRSRVALPPCPICDDTRGCCCLRQPVDECEYCHGSGRCPCTHVVTGAPSRPTDPVAPGQGVVLGLGDEGAVTAAIRCATVADATALATFMDGWRLAAEITEVWQRERPTLDRLGDYTHSELVLSEHLDPVRVAAGLIRRLHDLDLLDGDFVEAARAAIEDWPNSPLAPAVRQHVELWKGGERPPDRVIEDSIELIVAAMAFGGRLG